MLRDAAFPEFSGYLAIYTRDEKKKMKTRFFVWIMQSWSQARCKSVDIFISLDVYMFFVSVIGRALLKIVILVQLIFLT